MPEGSYVLRIVNPSDKQNQEVAGGMRIAEEKTIHSYGDLEQTIKVDGDIPTLVLAVPEQTKHHAASQ